MNIVVDPQQHGRGIGTAMLLALLEQPLLADVATLGGSVDVTNAGSLGMLRKLGATAVTTEKRRDGTTFHPFTIPRPGNSAEPTRCPPGDILTAVWSPVALV
ncbi:hypothetical protein PWJ90_32430 [Nocardia gipuzkoensis]|nr:GNAT family N-acetyltransferase [Nocardia gipuzkoensis]MDE1674331.1 hypothetical protein [Nocardia gipuzkoensis]